MEETIIRQSAALVMVFLMLFPSIAWNVGVRARHGAVDFA